MTREELLNEQIGTADVARLLSVRERAKFADSGPWTPAGEVKMTRPGKDFASGGTMPKPITLAGTNLDLLNNAREDILFLAGVIDRLCGISLANMQAKRG